MTTRTSLEEIIKADKDAVKFGINWSDYDNIIINLISECEEIRAAIVNGESNERVQEEIGDLLFGVCSLCRFLNFDIEQIAKNSKKKFNSRVRAIKILTKQRGLKNLNGQPYSLLIQIWNEAKVASQSKQN